MFMRFSTRKLFGALLVAFMLERVDGAHHSHSNQLKCDFVPGLTVGNRSTELKCCEMVVKNYYKEWSLQNQYLSTFLDTLLTWNCPQFKEECQRRSFNYTIFSSLMYSRFCDPPKLVNQCHTNLRKILLKQNCNVFSNTKTWTETVSMLDLNSFSDQDLLDPCLQVALYDVDSSGHGHYQEIIKPIVAFCPFVWCGFDDRTARSRQVAAWTCMPNNCRRNVIIFLFVTALLAVVTFVCNASILGVLLFSKNLHTVQGVYRLSLALADIVVGAIVFPTFVISLYKYLIESHPLLEVKNVTGYYISDNSLQLKQAVRELKEPTGAVSDYYSEHYINAAGFFTVLSLFVSVHTMVAASFDRFIAIFRPLRYNELTAIFAGKVSVAIIWIVGVVFAALPVYVPNLGYAFVASILISSVGEKVFTIYSICFFIQIALMWILITATFVTARSSIRSIQSKKQQMKDQMSLATTLGIMICVFTFCVLPIALVLLSAVFLPRVNIEEQSSFIPSEATKYNLAEMVVVLLFASNSLWNCFIYSARETSFRSAIKLLYKKIARLLKLDVAWSVVSRRDDSPMQVPA